MLFLKFPKHFKSQKNWRDTGQLPKHCLFYGFMQNLFIEGHKMLLQKFPKQFLYFPRCLLMTVAKCAPEISETLFINVVPVFYQRRSNNTSSEISETTFTTKGCSIRRIVWRLLALFLYNDALIHWRISAQGALDPINVRKMTEIFTFLVYDQLIKGRRKKHCLERNVGMTWNEASIKSK